MAAGRSVGQVVQTLKFALPATPTPSEQLLRAFVDIAQFQADVEKQNELFNKLAAIEQLIPSIITILQNQLNHCKLSASITFHIKKEDIPPYTERSLVANVLGKVSSANPEFKLKAIQSQQIVPCVLSLLEESNPFTQFIALNLLIDWSDTVEVVNQIVAAKGITLLQNLISKHSAIVTAEFEAAEAQLQLRTYIMALFCMICSVNKYQKSIINNGALESAAKCIQEDFSEELLLHSLKLCALLLQEQSYKIEVKTAIKSVIYLIVLTTHPKTSVATASKFILSQIDFTKPGVPVRMEDFPKEEQDLMNSRLLLMQQYSEQGEKRYSEPIASPTAYSINSENSSTMVKCHADDCKTIESTSCKFSLCSRCRKASYCSKNCQVRHWKVHKPNCTAK